MKISESVIHYTESVVANCNLDSLSIFVCDKAREQPSLNYLFHHGVSQAAQAAYKQHRVFEQDPYSDDSFLENTRRNGRQSLILASELSYGETGHTNYWQFIHTHRLKVVGAATKALAEGIYLVIGSHCIEGKHQLDDVPITRLDKELTLLLSQVSGQIFSELLSQRSGYSAFQQLLNDAPTGDRLSHLSRREAEIADLVYRGCQNKQIAFELGLSEYTVDNHLRRIYRKAGVRNRTALAALVADTH